MGSVCDRPNDCASGRCDEFVCKAADPAGPGHACTNHLDCRSEQCTAGRCGAGTRAAGTPCTDDLQCAAGSCAAGRCADPFAPDAGVDGRAGDGGVDGDGPTSDSAASGPWPKLIGGNLDETAEALASDADDNIYLVGTFESESLDLGGPTPLHNAGDPDLFVASWTADGHFRWARQFAGWFERSFFTYTLVPDPRGGVVLAGSFGSYTIDLGDGPQTMAGAFDLFVVSLDSSGNHRWSHAFGGENSDQARGLAVDRAGNVYLSGVFSSAGIDFGGGALTNAGNGSADLFLASFDAAGQHRWSKSFGGSLSEEGGTLTIDRDADALFIAGTYQGTPDLGGGPLPRIGGRDIVLARFDTRGAHQWSLGLGSASSESAPVVATDGLGQVYLAAALGEGANLGGSDLPAGTFAATFDAGGVHQRSRNLPGIALGAGDQARVAADSAGNLLLVGNFNGEVDLGSGPLPWSGGQGSAVLGLAPDLSYQWSRGYVDSYLRAVSASADRQIFVVGTIYRTREIAGLTLTSVGLVDLFLLGLQGGAP